MCNSEQVYFTCFRKCWLNFLNYSTARSTGSSGLKYGSFNLKRPARIVLRTENFNPVFFSRIKIKDYFTYFLSTLNSLRYQHWAADIELARIFGLNSIEFDTSLFV